MVGQQLVINILKNSLYANYYFPVYLLMGLRGSGKTSTGRMFAAAINCFGLSTFQQNPRQQIPCLQCASCAAMMQGNHPDFIEIDAASHTGVDHMRTIIEAATLLPVLGQKKMYLIDEAHMLSKAAFNALLKILEEPPKTTLFMLATTDPEKIIDTVKSRCFHLIFKPINVTDISAQLAKIALHEGIEHDTAALTLIAQEGRGSVRDAINLLERVRFSGGVLTKELVESVLGYLAHEQIEALVNILFVGTHRDLCVYLQKNNLTDYSAIYIWRKLQELLRTILWLKVGVAPHHDISALFIQLSEQVDTQTVQRALEYLYTQELLFLKSSAQHAFLEMALFYIAGLKDEKKSGVIHPINTGTSATQSLSSVQQPLIIDQKIEVPSPRVAVQEGKEVVEKKEAVTLNEQFLLRVQELKDPLVNSILHQALITGPDQAGKLRLHFAKDKTFFTDLLESTQQSWLPFAQQIWGEALSYEVLFDQEQSVLASNPQKVSAGTVPPSVPAAAVVKKTTVVQPKESGNYYKKKVVDTVSIDISDQHKWPKINMLLAHFPGKVTEVKK